MDKSRPYSAYPLTSRGGKMQTITSNKNELLFKDHISPLRTTTDFYAKEELNEQVQTLKKLINALQEENKNLKSKIIRLEKKKVNLLLTPFKTFNNIAFSPDLEKQKLLLRISELELEVNVLKDESIRHKIIIDEFINKVPYDYKKLFEKYIKLSSKIKKIKEGKKKTIGYYGSDIESNKRFNEISGKNSDRKILGKKNSPQFKQRNSMLVMGIFIKLYEGFCVNQLENDEIWYVVNPNNCDSIGFQEFSRGMNGLGIINDEEIEVLFEVIARDGRINQRMFEKAFIKYKPSNIPNYSDIKPAIEHLYYRLQIQRITFNNFLCLFPAEGYTYDDILQILTRMPILLDKTSAEIITKYILINKTKTEKNDIENKLRKIMDEWKIFNEDEEVVFDDKIRSSMDGHWEVFIEKCHEFDKGKREIISFSQFVRICKSIGFELEPDMKQYLKILFYTDKFQLEIVPYKGFVVAYAPENYLQR
ncbi:hypothetical protein SteCoe_16283 [Stentor coeruleus]|uniref:EF-hand domain-containing protein n=1 Tax=Stentor coeruleus TaxID=5963 RepID=A0A1R2C1R1_9CILI|nr:hypothetical protein SteCoe_16283 [Stentor coeruleus]